MADDVLRPDQLASLIAFLAQHENINREFVYDASDPYCHVAVRYDPERGLRQITSGPRDNVIYSDHPLEPAEALALVRDHMTRLGWVFPD